MLGQSGFSLFRSDGMRCMKYRLEYNSTRFVRFCESSVGTRILEKTFSFHSCTAASTVSLTFHDLISSSLYLHALSTDIIEMPTRDRTVGSLEFDHVKSAPMRSFSGPDVSLALPNIGCGTGPSERVWSRLCEQVNDAIPILRRYFVIGYSPWGRYSDR